MYCSECGKPAHGKFCSHCGTRIEAEAPVECVDWENEVRYDLLVRVPVVRAAIDRHAATARKRMTGEQFLAICDKVFSPPVSMETVSGIVQPLYARLGIGIEKRREETLPGPVGRTIADALCSTAAAGQAIRCVRQGTDGCVIEASIPSDLRSLEGTLIVTIGRDARGTVVEATAQIPGQFFDWGKSRGCLDRLFGDLRRSVEHARAAA